MIFALVCWVGTFTTGPLHLVRQDAVLVRWVGQSPAQIQTMLGEEATVSMTAGGTDNLRVMHVYANARLVVWYEQGVAVKVQRTK